MSTPAPGWYPDPDQPAEARYWDGTIWTGARRAVDAMGQPDSAPKPPRDRRMVALVIALLALVALIGGFVVGSFVLDGDGSGSETVVAKRRPSTSTSTSTSTSRPDLATTTTTAFVPPPPEAVPGTSSSDLRISGQPMTTPPCDGSYIVHLAAATTPGRYEGAISALLAKNPGSRYLRTDATCPSLRASEAGNPIYSVYYGPYRTLLEACTALSGSPGAYIRILDTVTAPGTQQRC